jgi:homocysteine S-methyltransferase
VNCCAPDDVLAAIAIADIGKPIIVYPNSGEHWDGKRRSWIGASRFSGQRATQWVAAGARIVGGCCRVGPTDIADLRRACTEREKSVEDSQ